MATDGNGRLQAMLLWGVVTLGVGGLIVLAGGEAYDLRMFACLAFVSWLMWGNQ